MNEEDLKLFDNLFTETTKLYDLFIKLKDLDQEKNTTYWFDTLSYITDQENEIDKLYELIRDKDLVRQFLEFIKQATISATIDNSLIVFANKNTLILKRIYNELINMAKTSSDAFEDLLDGYFKKEAKKNISYNTYLAIALLNFDLEVSIRTIELLENKKELNNIKYTLAFLSPNVHFILKEGGYTELPHSFNGNTIINFEYNVDDKKKEEYKNMYGYFLFIKALSFLNKSKNDNEKTYYKTLIRVSTMFLNDDTINKLLNSIKNIDNYDEIELLTKYKNKDLENANQFTTKLNKETAEVINKLLEISGTIKNTYSSLNTLEINDGKDTVYYDNMLNYLKATIDEEKVLYEYFDLMPDEITVATEYLYEILDKKNYRETISNVAFDNDEEELIVLRVAQKLHKKALDNEDYLYDIAEDTDIKICENDLDFAFLKHYMKYYDEHYNLELLRLLESNEEEKTYNYYKYNLAFLDDEIEENLLNNKLDNINRTLDKTILAFVDKVNSEKISFINNKYALYRFTLIIDDILEYDDPSIFDEEYDEETKDLLDRNMEELANFDNPNNPYASMTEEDLESLAEEEELDEMEELFLFNLFIAEFKSCVLFTDNIGLNEIRKRLDEKYKYYSSNRQKLFKMLYGILDDAPKLKEDANKDGKTKKIKK